VTSIPLYELILVYRIAIDRIEKRLFVKDNVRSVNVRPRTLCAVENTNRVERGACRLIL